MNIDLGLVAKHSGAFLGRLFDTHHVGDLRLGSYLDIPTLTKTQDAPAAVNWKAFPTPSGEIPAPDEDPLSNDYLACCVFSAPGHMINLVAKQLGLTNLVVTAEMVKAEYLKRTGGLDNGYYVREMLDIWATDGLWGTKIDGYCTVDKNNPDEVAWAVWLGGGLIGGYDLPLASKGQVDEKGRQLCYVPAGGWPKNEGPGTWGGHALFQRGTSPGIDDYNSWGGDLEATFGWRKECCSELYLPMLQIWQGADGRCPNGFAYRDLLADVRARA